MSKPIASFTKLNRVACKASVMLEGLTGSGKSGAALMLAYGLEGGFKDTPETNAWERIFTIDTENRSLNLFVGLPASWGGQYGQWNGTQLSSEDGYAPSNYLYLRDAAIQAGAGTVISDSITHMWTAKGGVLDKVNDIKNNNPKMDNYRVWGDPVVAAEKQALIDVIRDARCHVITTVRVKEKFDLQFDEQKQKSHVVSLGEQQLQQEGLKYEPDLVLHMVAPGNSSTHDNPKVTVLKSRYAIFNKDETYELTPALCEQLRQYLAEGVDINDLLEQQKQDYVRAITEVLDTNVSAKTIWPTLKKDAGVADMKLSEIALNTLKHLYTQLISD